MYRICCAQKLCEQRVFKAYFPLDMNMKVSASGHTVEHGINRCSSAHLNEHFRVIYKHFDVNRSK